MKQKKITRRYLFGRVAAGGLGLAGIGSPGTPALAVGGTAVEPVAASEVLVRLKEGNRRFVEERTKHDHESRNWRNSLVSSQKPLAVIVGCADSRVPPELVFDQGFGDLFVIRNAGNVIATDVLGSIEYAILHLHTPLVVVMGHESCGAVTAALMTRKERAAEPPELQAVLDWIDPALSGLDEKIEGERRLAAAVEANVRWGVRQLVKLQDERRDRMKSTAQFVGAVYGLKTGKVRFLE